MPEPVDRREVEALFAQYGPLVRRRARSILGNEAEAEDMVQDVFVRVLGALAEFRRESQPSTWLYRITTNLCLNRIRDHKRHHNRLEEFAVGSLARGTTEGGPGPEARIAVAALLAKMPPDLAEVAVYYHVDEMDQDEIARLTGVARRTVGYRLDRFRELAREYLTAERTAAGVKGTKP